MTIPAERTRAAVYAGAFLRDLLHHQVTPNVPQEVRDTAMWLLRHYPDPWMFEKAHEGAPEWWGPLPEQLHWRAPKDKP
jgi:hypothetical protein